MDNKIIEREGYYSLDIEGQMKISELIELLEFMKNKFGDKTILIEDGQRGFACGFSSMYFHSNEEARQWYPDEEDDIRILI